MDRDAAAATFADETMHPWTSGFVLRPLNEADSEDLLAHFSDPRVIEYLDVEPFKDIGDVTKLLEWADGIRADGTGIRWSIRDMDNEGLMGAAFVGTCGFHRLDFDQGCKGQIGYDVRPELWGEGVMAQVLPAMLEYGFGPLGLHRIEAFVTPGNDRSCRLLDKCGFKREGTLRDYAHWRGGFHDQVLYSRLVTDE